jgi:hypothetical protein
LFKPSKTSQNIPERIITALTYRHRHSNMESISFRVPKLFLYIPSGLHKGKPSALVVMLQVYRQNKGRKSSPASSDLIVNGLRVCSHGGLLERLSKRRMGMACPRDVLAGRAVLESQGAFCDHLTGIGADDVNTK